MKIDEHLGGIAHIVRIAQFGDVLLHDLLNLVLERDIQCRINNHVGTRQLAAFEVEDLLKLQKHEIKKVRRAIYQTGRMLEETGTLRLSERVEFLHAGNVALVEHSGENDLEARICGLRVQEWVVGIGRIGQARQHCGLRQVELLRRRFAGFILQPEIDRRRRVDAICLLAIVDGVQIHFQDVALAIVVVYRWRERKFLQFALDAFPIAHHQHLDELLGDGTAPLHDTPAAQVIQRGLDNARNIDALVRPEVLILGCHGSVDEVRRDVIERDAGVYPLIGQLTYEYALAIVHFQVVAGHQFAQREHFGNIFALYVAVIAVGDKRTGPGYRGKDDQQREEGGADNQPETREGAPCVDVCLP